MHDVEPNLTLNQIRYPPQWTKRCLVLDLVMMNKNTKAWLRKACIGIAAGMWLALSTGCVGVAYPGGAAVYYDYDYYPGWNIYFYPAGHIYYWNEGGHWRSGAHLPPAYHLNGQSHEQLRLHSRQPWTEHH